MSLSIAFALVFSLYVLDQYMTTNSIDSFVDTKGKIVLTKNFLSSPNNADEKLIFIIGSSQVQSLNTTFIHNYLLEHSLNYTVYNFGQPADTPTERLKSIDTLIAKKPDVVVYGFSYRDFMSSSPSELQNAKIVKYLPDPSSAFKKISVTLNIPITAFDFLENPAKVTFDAIKFFSSISKRIFLPTSKSATNETNLWLLNQLNPGGYGVGKSVTNDTTFWPFPNANYRIPQRDTIILTDDELKNYYNRNAVADNRINSFDNNDNVAALEEIISKLQSHHIKLILFITPESRYFLNTLGDSDKKEFNLIIQNISSQYELEIYSLNDKYADLRVWKDLDHVAINDNVTIYNKDMSNHIIQELES